MSEARNQRFEIDIDEIERQLRRSVDAAATRPDPLAELARIVGQSDPFGGMLAKDRLGAAGSTPPLRPANDPILHAPDRAVLYGTDRGAAPQPQDELFDPVSETYGSADDAIEHNDLQSLRPRRSRGRLAAVMASLLVTAGAVAGGLYWRQSGGRIGLSSTPPVVTADRTPLKVAPENPGGIDVPNQNRQIYERTTPPDGQSRVVDGREQPIDVREAARSLPVSPPPAPVPAALAPTVSARSPVASTDPVAGPRPAPVPGAGLTPVAPDAAPAPMPRSNAVANALGEPRRVRTSAVRPDGSIYTPTSTSSVSEAPQSLLPGSTFPPPVPVSTVSVSNRPAPAAPAPAAVAAAAAPSAEAEGVPSGPSVRVLPPARPKIEARAATEAPVRTASVQPAATPKPAAPKPAAAATPARTGFSVQIAVRPTDEEARQAYAQLQGKYASDLDGRGAQVTRAEVNGKTVHRVRVGPMSKDDATALCTRLKSSGGSCFVAGN